MRRCVAVAALLVLLAAAAFAEIEEAHVRALVSDHERFAELKGLGPDILPVLARIYESSSAEERASIAATFYRLGWKSDDAKRVLMRDVHTDDPSLRLQVQWALGRVSGDDDVVEVLLANMQHDDNPLFRDKAACALAHDQIHLSPEQKVRLLAGVIEALADEKPQVRRIARQVLKIQTGQTKGFDWKGTPEERARAVAAWRQWLDEYRANL
jgi:hypothetical protein